MSDLRTGMMVQLKDGCKWWIMLNTTHGNLYKKVNSIEFFGMPAIEGNLEDLPDNDQRISKVWTVEPTDLCSKPERIAVVWEEDNIRLITWDRITYKISKESYDMVKNFIRKLAEGDNK